jgi:hypothetical protein
MGFAVSDAGGNQKPEFTETNSNEINMRKAFSLRTLYHIHRALPLTHPPTQAQQQEDGILQGCEVISQCERSISVRICEFGRVRICHMTT